METRDWKIEAALMYRDRPDFPLAALRAGLNTGLARFRLEFRVKESAADRAVFSNGIVDVVVARLDRPLPPARFARALEARFARVRPNDYATPLAVHDRAVMVEAREAPDCGLPVPVETRIVIAHAAVLAVQGLAWPDLVHWSQSDTLFLPEEVPQIEGIGFPAMLVTRPEITAAGTDPRGRRRFSVVAGLSEHWFGKPVTVAPTTQALPEVLAVIDFFLVRHIAGDEVLAQDGVMALSDRTEVVIRHLDADARFLRGRIELTFRARAQERRAPGPVPLVPQAIPPGAQPVHLADYRRPGTRRRTH
jgi:hypothetical protein